MASEGFNMGFEWLSGDLLLTSKDNALIVVQELRVVKMGLFGKNNFFHFIRLHLN